MNLSKPNQTKVVEAKYTASDFQNGGNIKSIKDVGILMILIIGIGVFGISFAAVDRAIHPISQDVKVDAEQGKTPSVGMLIKE